MMNRREFNWGDDSVDLLRKRFGLNGPEDIDAWLREICKIIVSKSNSHDDSEKYYKLIAERKFFPTSTILRNATKASKLLSGCAVIPIKPETLPFFRETIPIVAELLAHGVGVGIDFTPFFPRLFFEDSENTVSGGPTAMLESITSLFDIPIAYSGVKRSAFMASILFDHPDVFEMIWLKTKSDIPNANISVGIDSIFKESLERNGWIPMRWRGKDDVTYLTLSHLELMKKNAWLRQMPPPDFSVINNGIVISNAADGRTVGRVIGDVIFVQARVVLNEISRAAYRTGEPGIIDLGLINQNNSTNPKNGSSQDVHRPRQSWSCVRFRIVRFLFLPTA